MQHRDMRRLKKHLLILSLVISGSSQACLWDSDTIATESARFPGAAGMMAGNFPRHSKEYHEWRVKQKKALVDAGTATALDYDDLAVSQHKLEGHHAAIATMLAKEKKNPGIYETYSNLGTFYIYTGDLKTALQYIDKALSINPNAHFGREKYQRWLVMWLQEKKGQAAVEPASRERYISNIEGAAIGFAAFIARQYKGGAADTPATPPTLTEAQQQRAVHGVTGMMYFADFDNPILQEALGDLLSSGKFNVNASQLAALCYLHASEKTSTPEEESRLKKLMRQALVVTRIGKDDNVEQEMLKTLNAGLASGQKLNEQVRTDEMAWIAAGQDAAVEFQKKYLQPAE
jgi:tetratricopeptide (TPR) repeat protein